MSLFFPLTMTRIRKTGQYISGKWVASEDSTLTIKGSVQPTSGMELQNLPEGERTDGLYKIYTKTELRSSEAGTSIQNDQISYNNLTYDVIHVYPWLNGVQSHYKAILRRVKEL